MLATCKNLWSCMWLITFPFKIWQLWASFPQENPLYKSQPLLFLPQKNMERGETPVSIWKMQLRSLGFSAKKREIHQATKQTNWNYTVWLIKASLYLWHSLSMCPTSIAWSSWCKNSLGHNLSGFFILWCAFWFFILSAVSSPWALWLLVAGSSASSLGIYSIAAPLLHWWLHVLTRVIMSWLKSAVWVMSKECAMVYYFKPFFRCTQHAISYPISSRYWIVLGAQFRTQFGARCRIRHQADNMPLKQVVQLFSSYWFSPESRLKSRCSLGISVSSQSGWWDMFWQVSKPCKNCPFHKFSYFPKQFQQTFNFQFSYA
jgi:hypothetical protein